MRAFKTREFGRTAYKEKVTDAELRKAIRRTIEGKVDAELGAYLLKQRISQGKGGRTGGHRAIIVYKEADRIVFLHLFGKSEKPNLTALEKKSYRKAAGIIANLDADALVQLLERNEWIEIDHADDEEQGLSE